MKRGEGVLTYEGLIAARGNLERVLTTTLLVPPDAVALWEEAIERRRHEDPQTRIKVEPHAYLPADLVVVVNERFNPWELPEVQVVRIET